MVDIRYIPLIKNSLNISVRHSRAGENPVDLIIRRIPCSLVAVLCTAVLFTGCATSTTTHRTPAKVEDRTASPETAPPAPVQEEPSARVYKLEEPEYVPPQPLTDTAVEEQSIELEPEVSTEQSVEMSSSSSTADVTFFNHAVTF